MCCCCCLLFLLLNCTAISQLIPGKKTCVWVWSSLPNNEKCWITRMERKTIQYVSNNSLMIVWNLLLSIYISFNDVCLSCSKTQFYYYFSSLIIPYDPISIYATNMGHNITIYKFRGTVKKTLKAIQSPLGVLFLFELYQDISCWAKKSSTWWDSYT